MAQDHFWIIIPARAFDQGKTRLAPDLDPATRKAFSRECFRHVLRTARRVAGPARILTVSGSGEVLGLARSLGAGALKERRPDLNAAVEQALRHAVARGARAVLVMHADLPRIRAQDARRLQRAVARRRGAAIAPDALRQGTNALALRPAGAFRFQFGVGSFALHCAEARRRRMRVRIVTSPGLGFDVDTPAGYRALRRDRQDVLSEAGETVPAR